MKKLNALTLKEELWQTLQKLKEGRLEPKAALSISSQANQILRTIKLQTQILGMANEKITKELLDFAKNKKLG